MAATPLPAHSASRPLSPECAVPDRLLTFPRALQPLEELLRQQATLKVLVVGLSSVDASPSQEPRDPFSARLAAELERRFPGVEVVLKNEGIGGELAAATVERMKREVVDWGPDLVVWQVGTNDAIARTDPQDFVSALREGVDWLAQRGVEVVLMNPQFFPRVAHEPAYQAYLEAVEEVATGENVPLLRRYEAMQHWSARQDAGPGPPAPDGLPLGDQGHSCVAEALAEAVARQVDAK